MDAIGSGRNKKLISLFLSQEFQFITTIVSELINVVGSNLTS